MANLETSFSEHYVCINTCKMQCDDVSVLKFQVAHAYGSTFNIFLLISDLRAEQLTTMHSPLCAFMLKCGFDDIIKIVKSIIISFKDIDWPRYVVPMMDVYNLLIFGSPIEKEIYTCPVNMVGDNVLIGPLQNDAEVFWYFSPTHCDLIPHYSLSADMAFSHMHEIEDAIEYYFKNGSFRVRLDWSFYIGGGACYTIPE